MKRKITLALAMITMLGLAGQALAFDFSGGGLSTNVLGTDYSLWGDTNNWVSGELPTAVDARILTNAYVGGAQTIGGHAYVGAGAANVAMLVDTNATLNVPTGGKDLIIGSGGGLGTTFDLRGIATINDFVFIQEDAVLTINGGTLTSADDMVLTDSASMVINGGSYSNGDFLKLNGTSSVILNSGALNPGDDIEMKDTSTLVLNGGTMDAADGAIFEMFDQTSAEFNNATVAVGNHITIGEALGRTGPVDASMLISNSTVTLYHAGNDAYTDIRIGRTGGTGHLEVTDSTVTLDELIVGTGNNGLVGHGTLDFNSGEMNVRQTLVGNSVDGSTGTINIGDGATLNHTESLKIGQALNSVGIVNVASNGVLNMTDKIILGNAAGADGTLNMAGGSILTAVNGFELGAAGSGTGTVNMDAGSTATFGTTVRIGDATDSVGTLNNDGTLNVGTDLIVAAGIGSTATYTSINGGTVNMGGDLIIAGRASSTGTVNVAGITLSPGGALEVANGLNSVAILNSAAPIALNSTNGLHVGTGTSGTHNLTSADFVVTGPLGDFSVGASTGASITDMINQNDSIGSLEVNTALDINDKDHKLTGLTQNAALTFSGTSTHSFIGGGAITLANNDNANVALVLGDLNPIGDINLTGFSIGTGSNAVGSFSLNSGALNVAGLLEIGSADGTGTLTMNGGSVSAADVAIGAGGTVLLIDGLLTVTSSNTLTMAAGSSLEFGQGTLVWSNTVDAASIIGGFVTDGLITWDSTNPEYTGLYDERYENGSGSALFVVTGGGATTVFAAIPEPSTIGMFTLVGGGLLWFRRRSRN